MLDQQASLTPQRRNAIRALLAVAVLVVVMDITILNVALEEIQRGLQATNAELQWSLNSYAITFAAFIFTAGVCGDRFGRKRTLIVGLIIFGGASVLAAFSPSMGWLIGWRAVMGVGAAVVPTVTLAIIMNVFPPAERMKAIATWAAAAGVAFAAGPLVGGVLLEWFSWGSVFLINAPLVVIGVALIARLVPESRAPASAGFDPAGVMLSIAAVGLLVFGIVDGRPWKRLARRQRLGPDRRRHRAHGRAHLRRVARCRSVAGRLAVSQHPLLRGHWRHRARVLRAHGRDLRDDVLLPGRTRAVSHSRRGC